MWNRRNSPAGSSCARYSRTGDTRGSLKPFRSTHRKGRKAAVMLYFRQVHDQSAQGVWSADAIVVTRDHAIKPFIIIKMNRSCTARTVRGALEPLLRLKTDNIAFLRDFSLDCRENARLEGFGRLSRREWPSTHTSRLPKFGKYFPTGETRKVSASAIRNGVADP
jgi:hypothetical protein